MDKPENTMQQIGIIERGAVARLVLSAGTYKNKPRVDFRLYFRNDDGKWLPTKRGLTVSTKEFQEFRAMLDTLDGFFNDDADNGNSSPKEGYPEYRGDGNGRDRSKKDQVIELLKAGQRTTDIAREVGCSKGFVSQVRKEFSLEGV